MPSAYLFRILLIILAGGHSAAVIAQAGNPGATVYGRVLAGQDSLPVEYASVVLATAQDSTVVDFQLTGEDGSFRFTDVAAGDYAISVSRVGYPDRRFPVPGLAPGAARRVALLTGGGGTDLTTVEVTGNRPTVTFRGSKMIVAVDQLPGAVHSDGLEILSCIPGIRVDGEQISLNGFGDVSVLINGRKRTMTAAQAATLLSGIPASSIRSIEVTSGKSVNQDAAGTGGEINIVTDRALGQFFNLSLRNQLIIDDRLSNVHSAYLNANGRRLRFNGGLNYRRDYRYGTYQRREHYTDATDNRPLATNRVDGISDFLSHAPSANAGLEYDLGSRQRIGVNASAYFTHKSGTAEQLSQWQAAGTESRATSLTETGTVGDNLTTVDAYYDLDLDTLGSTLKTAFGYLTGYVRESSTFDLRQPPGSGSAEALRLRTDFPLSGAQYSLRSDLEKQLNTDTKILAGFKLSDGRIDNYVVYDTISFLPPRRNIQLSDSLGYRERVSAVYLSGQRIFGSLTVQVGGRYELTSVSTTNRRSGATGGQDYGNFFPNASLSYDAGENYQFSLSYSASLTRPDYLDLNPYTKYLDNFTVARGNNALRPQRAHRLVLNTRWFRLAQLNFGYIRGKDYIWQVRELLDDGITTRITPQNAYDITAGYVQAILPYRFGPEGKFSGQLSGLLVPFGIEPREEFGDRGQSGSTDTRISGGGNFRYKWSARLSLETDWYYNHSRLLLQNLQAPRWRANLGCTYELPGDALTVSAALNDLFNTNNAAGERFFPGQTATYASDYNTRRLQLTLRYRLGGLEGNYRRRPEGEVNRFQ